MRPTLPLLLSAALALAARPVAAHSADGAATCFGFAFGRWRPTLDLAAAGHAAARDDGAVAPSGRSWAADGDRAPADSAELMLLPGWWPAGVRVRAARLPGAGDTVKATAVALVANGNATPPRALALLWGKRCSESVQRTASPPPPDVAPRRSPRDTARASPPPPPTRR